MLACEGDGETTRSGRTAGDSRQRSAEEKLPAAARRRRRLFQLEPGAPWNGATTLQLPGEGNILSVEKREEHLRQRRNFDFLVNSYNNKLFQLCLFTFFFSYHLHIIAIIQFSINLRRTVLLAVINFPFFFAIL